MEVSIEVGYVHNNSLQLSIASFPCLSPKYISASLILFRVVVILQDLGVIPVSKDMKDTPVINSVTGKLWSKIGI